MKKTYPDIAPINITFGINEVKLLHFEITQKVKELKGQIVRDLLEFRFDMKSEIIESEKLFVNNLVVTIFEKQSDVLKIELAKQQTLTSFKIINFEEVIKKVDNELKIPDQLFSLTAGISISTARGMLVMNLKDTLISNAIIPIIDPKTFQPSAQPE